jgi:aminocarboxymuconate-semialdehyde decarboxylase
VILGTDYPSRGNRVPVDHMMSVPGLSDDERIAILGGTAAKLLGIKS